MLRILKYAKSFLVALSLVLYCHSAAANITSIKFCAGQEFDAQRSPAFPVANKNFTLAFFNNPYRFNNTQYVINTGEYIKLFFVGGVCKDGQVGINRYNAQGKLLETVQDSGHIYGLAPQGFLHDNDHNIGTLITMQPLNNGSVTYIPKTGPSPETCAALEAFVPETKPPNCLLAKPSTINLADKTIRAVTVNMNNLHPTGDTPLEVTTNFAFIAKLITLCVYLISICLIIVATYLLGARGATQTKTSVRLPVSIILLGVVLIASIFFMSQYFYVFLKYHGRELLLADILLILFGFFLLGKRRAKPINISIQLPFVLLIIGILLLCLPSLFRVGSGPYG